MLCCAPDGTIYNIGALKFDVLGQAGTLFAISLLSAAVELLPGGEHVSRLEFG